MQTLVGYYTFLGDAPMARTFVEQSDRGQGAPPRKARKYTYEAGLTARPAIEEIVRAAKGKQIVILNENHSASQNRAFGTLLARALRKEGFTYFAAETFAPHANIEATQKRGYPDRKTGYYTLDPVFGDLARQVQRAGYKLVAYETEDENRPPDFVDATNARETAQSHNLTERILRKKSKWNPTDARRRGWRPAWKKETGIDPLTIDQSELFEPIHAGTEGREPANPVERFHITQPSVLRRADGSSWRTGTGAGTMDMQVFHPFVREKQGCPDWLQMNGYRKPFPVDHVLLTAGKPTPVLMLPKGRYRLVMQDETGASRPVGVVTQK